ncbi:longitudinals lacking protein-like [Thrips palmi]|uniref:Longitudinals lacking protein-like n=1 Tax=Thrips palmi TaxID=161013 RepID=A0A6P9A0M1_THRPL|nr:longitudinals lacking protein-like [Thrips palmi]
MADWLDKWYGLQISFKKNMLGRPELVGPASGAVGGPTSPSGGGKEVAKAYECPKCGRSYMWKNTLMRHLRNECGIEPQFQCPFCPHRTKLKSNLTQHIRYKHMSPAAMTESL